MKKYISKLKSFINVSFVWMQTIVFFVLDALRTVWWVVAPWKNDNDIPVWDYEPFVLFSSNSYQKPTASNLAVIRYTFSSLTSAFSLGSMIIEADEWGNIKSAIYQTIADESMPMAVVNGEIKPTADSSLPTLAENEAKLTVFDKPNDNGKYLQISCNAAFLQLNLLVIPGLEYAYIVVKEQ